MADLLALLNEISSEKPCGDYLEYDPAYLELLKNIVGKPEDPISGESAQPPNWRDIHKDTLALLQRSKDLQVVVCLLRSLINLEGIAGFRDGLNLLLGLLQKYWPEIHPVLDPDDDLDPTARINIIEELSNFDSVLRPLSLSPLVDAKSVGRFSLRDIHLATDKIEVPEGAVKPDLSLIKAAFLDASPELVKASHDAIIDSISSVQQVEAFIDAQVGSGNGADLSPLVALLKEMRVAVEQFADATLGSENLDSDQVDPGLADSAYETKLSRQQTAVLGINSRQDVLQALDLICKYYADNEPSSPVPILLRRAKHLATSDFMQIVHNLLPDGVSQLELIKGPDPDAN